ncbi:MAG: three-Cys-motif partner protein TcmP [Lachnospiraceae bacterium]|nr:three-Cys-motif partner protein TcmP [Lachnospiraceae bacterium]
MGKKQQFGGKWTVEKLDILKKYIHFYTTALKRQNFHLIYIDAFAGTGNIELARIDDDFDYVTTEEFSPWVKNGTAYESINGSAKIALDAPDKFDRYYFIERNPDFAKELEELTRAYPDLDTKIINADCNEALVKICKEVNWSVNRAVLFLDPYASELKWKTLVEVSKTKSIDVWYLFPFSVVNRLMKKDGKISSTWRAKLTDMLGDDSWEEEFYEENTQLSLFDTGSETIRRYNEEKLKAYIVRQLETVFAKVSEKPRILYNTKNSAMFLFCFAVSNESPTAQKLAMKAADQILGKESGN